jgi:hypothetical protein
MFCAIELRQLAINREEGATDLFVVLKDGQVFDAGLAVWERGVDWGMPARELQWRVPTVSWRMWNSNKAAAAEEHLSEALTLWGRGLQVLDARRAVVEWLRPAPCDWQALVDRLVPSYAGAVKGGLAPHPLLARWVARAGAALRLPTWHADDGSMLWICDESAAGQVWKTVPLNAVPVAAAERRRWRQTGARRVGDVPGLSARLNRQWDDLSNRPQMLAKERFAEALQVGVAAALERLAHQLAARLAEAGLAAPGLALRWEPEWGPAVERRHTWTYAAQLPRILALRALRLAEPWPDRPPVALELAALSPVIAEPDQLRWEFAPPSRRIGQPFDLSGRAITSVREERLGFWDPWRQGGVGHVSPAR